MILLDLCGNLLLESTLSFVFTSDLYVVSALYRQYLVVCFIKLGITSCPSSHDSTVHRHMIPLLMLVLSTPSRLPQMHSHTETPQHVFLLLSCVCTYVYASLSEIERLTLFELIL